MKSDSAADAPENAANPVALPATPHRRRVRYAGKNPRRFEEKYKEREPERYRETAQKVLASGKTLAGTHRPIMAREIVDILAPKPGGIVVDCTLGYGGHARDLLARIAPAGRLIGIDRDPIELPKTEARLRSLGYGPEVFTAHLNNFAAVPKVLAVESLCGADSVLADLGVSSMQFDDPARGFSFKTDGPLDMRMNPLRGCPVSELLRSMGRDELARMLSEYSDEPHAATIGGALAGGDFTSTLSLADAIGRALSTLRRDEAAISVRRVFQALRIAVNEELSSLAALLRVLPLVVNPGGHVAILTFHSGEDRLVKKRFRALADEGWLLEKSGEVLRPSPEEQHANPRSVAAKLRWIARQ